MHKEEFLQNVRELAAAGTITESELVGAYRAARKDAGASVRLGISEVLYYIGGAIVCIGIGIFLFQNWGDLNMATRIIATLGSSIAAYVVGVLFKQYKNLGQVSDAFFLIASAVLPIGLGVTFHEYGTEVGNPRMQSVMSLIAFAVMLSSYTLYRRIVFMIFGVLFGTWAYFSVISWVIGTYPVDTLFEYVVLAAGIAYVLLGYGFVNHKDLRVLTGVLYSIGLIAALGSALALGGWTPEQNVFWEVIFPGLALGTAFLGAYLKSRSFLVFGSMYLMAYIIKITAEYFSDTLGWPLALVICGFALIAIGYGAFYVNKKYLGQK